MSGDELGFALWIGLICLPGIPVAIGFCFVWWLLKPRRRYYRGE